MLNILMISSDNHAFDDLAACMKMEIELDLSWAKSAKNALKIITDGHFDLVITDENLTDMTGIDLVKKIVSLKPMIHHAVVSRLSHDDFHAVSEGLGILVQLPPNPGLQHAQHLLKQTKKLLNFPVT